MISSSIQATLNNPYGISKKAGEDLLFEYSKYLELVDEELYQTKVDIQNVYPKSNNDILKLKSKNFEFFANILFLVPTTVPKPINNFLS